MDVFNLSELARYLGVRRCWLDDRQKFDPKFPKPVSKHGASKLWSIPQLDNYIKAPNFKIYSIKEAVEELDLSYITWNQYRHRNLFPKAVNLNPVRGYEKHYTQEQVEEMRLTLTRIGFYSSNITKAQRARRKREKEAGN